LRCWAAGETPYWAPSLWLKSEREKDRAGLQLTAKRKLGPTTGKRQKNAGKSVQVLEISARSAIVLKSAGSAVKSGLTC
jgi:hypothetical protein